MRKLLLFIAIVMTIVAQAQTLNVVVGGVTYKIPASQAGDMTYTNGSTLTILNKTFTLSEITQMYVDESEVTDNSVSVTYSGTSAAVTVAGNIMQYVTVTTSGAHVSLAQSSGVNDAVGEITYTLSGSTTDGEFYLSGSYKSTVELNGVSITNTTPVYSGAAVHVQNGKRINIKVITGTTNTLTDASTGSQKGALYVKGHAEFKQKGTLNVYGNLKHAIKTGEYLTIKNCTINVKSAVSDGINCNEYFLMESGTLDISGVGDDGVQCEIDGDTSTGQTTDHENEDSGNIYITGGTVNINVTSTAGKGLKADGDINISDDATVTVKTSGKGKWDSDDSETKAASCLAADGNINISGGTLNLSSSGSGGKGIKCDGILTVSGGTTTVTTSGGLYYNNGTNENTNYTGNTDNISSSYYSSPKGIKAGVKTQNGSSYTYSGGITISGGKIYVTTSGHNAEGIESKNTLEITGGEIMVEAYDDAVNSGQDMTISGGYVYAHGTNNDGLDSNGNLYIKGGVVFAVGTSSPELAIDANSEDRKQLYVTGGTLFTIGGLESGSSLTQSCYYNSSWTRNTWYSMIVGNDTYAFKTPSSGGSTLVVSGSSQPTVKSGVTVSSGTSIFNSNGYVDATVTGGSNVSLSSYTGGNSGGGGGFNPGGGGGRPGGH